MKKYLFFLSAFSTLHLHAQLFTETLSEPHSITIKSTTQLLNGDLLIAGILDATFSYLFIRTSPTGDVLWTKSERNSYAHTITKVISTPDSGFIAVGTLNSYCFVAKYDKNNSVVFEKRFVSIPGETNAVYDIVQYSPTTYRLVGDAYNPTYSTTYAPYFALQESGNGSFTSSADLYHYDISAFPVSARRIMRPTNGTPTYSIIAGEIKYTSSSKGLLVIKYSIPSHFDYVRSIKPSVPGTKPLTFKDMAAVKDMNVYAIAGNIDNSSSLSTDGKGIVVLLNNDGSIRWAKEIEKVNINRILMEEDGSIVIIGYTRDTKTAFFAKFDYFGNLITQHAYSNLSFTPIYTELVKDKFSNGYYAIGLDDQSGTLLIPDVIISKLDSSGNSACNNRNITLTINNFDYTVSTEYMNYDAKSITATNVVYDGGTIYNPTKDTTCISYVGTEEHSPNKLSLSVYPNPSSSVLNIQLTNDATDAYLEILDITGRKLISRNFSGNLYPLDVSGLNPGIYTVQIMVDGQSKSLRFIKE